MNSEQLVSMLFSDLKGFSKVVNDDLKVKLHRRFTGEVVDHILTPANHFYYNTWGDAFFICGESPVAMAEVVLQMRDRVKNANWKEFGLSVSVCNIFSEKSSLKFFIF